MVPSGAIIVTRIPKRWYQPFIWPTKDKERTKLHSVSIVGAGSTLHGQVAQSGGARLKPLNGACKEVQLLLPGYQKRWYQPLNDQLKVRKEPNFILLQLLGQG